MKGIKIFAPIILLASFFIIMREATFSMKTYFNVKSPKKSILQLSYFINLRILKKRTLGNVHYGKNNWLFYATESDGAPLKDVLGLKYNMSKTYDYCFKEFGALKKMFDKNNLPFYILIAPNKSRVYSKYLNLSFLSLTNKKIQTPNAPFLVCEKALNDLGMLKYLMPDDIIESFSKIKDTLYYERDSHWSLRGASEAWNLLANRFNLTKVDKRKIYKKEKNLYTGDLVNMIPNENIRRYYSKMKDDYFYYKRLKSHPIKNFKNSNKVHIIINKDYSAKKSVFLIGDSFSSEVFNILRYHFHKVFFIHINDFKELAYESIRKNHNIDYVIYVGIERYFRR